jgi:hypothetical protein
MCYLFKCDVSATFLDIVEWYDKIVMSVEQEGDSLGLF